MLSSSHCLGAPHSLPPELVTFASSFKIATHWVMKLTLDSAISTISFLCRILYLALQILTSTGCIIVPIKKFGQPYISISPIVHHCQLQPLTPLLVMFPPLPSPKLAALFSSSPADLVAESLPLALISWDAGLVKPSAFALSLAFLWYLYIEFVCTSSLSILLEWP